MCREIDQRYKPEDRVIIHCDCGSYDHYVMFEYWRDDFGTEPSSPYKSFNLGLVLPPYGLWERIKKAIGYILKGGHRYYYEVGITQSDIEKIEKVFAGYKALGLIEEKESTK